MIELQSFSLSELQSAACDLRAPGPHTADIQAHPGTITFPPEGSVNALISTAHPLPADPFSVPTITDSYARARWPQHLITLPLRRPDCTLSRLSAIADEYHWPVTQSTAIPEPGCPGLHPRSSWSSQRPWVCHRTRKPTVVSRVSSRPPHLNVDRFHQPCLLPGRTPG